MIKADDLLQASRQFYQAADTVKPKYPEDRQEGGVVYRFCSTCGWQTVDRFSKRGQASALRRECDGCRR